MSKKTQLFILLIILFGAITVRLYRFSNPIADWHAWRQSDTSSVSRNFVKYGFDVLHPRFDDISNIPSGKDNPNGYRFVEFPIYNILQASFYKISGTFSLEESGRIVTIISSLLSIVFIYLLVKKYADSTAALFAAAFYAFLPFNIYYGRSILPDPIMVMASLGGIYFFDKWLDKDLTLIKYVSGKRSASRINDEIVDNLETRALSWLWYIISLIFTSGALLLKPYAIFFTLPIIFLVFNKFGFNLYKKWQLYVYVILALSPLILWRIWMLNYPEGIPASEWLFNGGDIRFKGAFFFWLFADRIGRLILGYWGLIIFGFGIISLARKKFVSKNLFLASFLVASLLYLFVIARGNVQHDYYQILIIPSLAIFLGLGSSFLLNLPKEYFHRSVGAFVLALSLIFSISFGWYYVRDFFNINNPSIIAAGDAVDKLTPENAKIIAILHGSEGDTTFLYQTNRQGWASFQNSLPELIQKGAEYLIFANPTKEDQNYAKEYKLVASNQDYIIFDLRKHLEGDRLK